MKLSIRHLQVFVMLMVFTLTACKELNSQNPADSFFNKKFPKQLEWMRSQLREIPLSVQEKIIERVKSDSQRNDLLKVGVIDSGVDIAHRDLVGQIDYKIENNRIVGAGADIMGNGKFGSHVFVDPTLFAFGAESLKGGLIVNPLESPLKFMDELDNRFKDIIMEGLQTDADLKKSLFARLQRSSFTFLAFSDLRHNQENSLQEYMENKKENAIFSTTKAPADVTKSDTNKRLNSWNIMDESRQHPEALWHITDIEHGDKFIHLIKKAYDTLDREMDFTKKLEIFEKFLMIRSGEEKTLDANRDFPDELKDTMKFVIEGVNAHDPIMRFKKIFKAHEQFKDLSFAEAFRKYYSAQKITLEGLLSDKTIMGLERKMLDKHKLQIETIGQVMENLIQLEADPIAYKKLHSDLRRYVYRTQHPYLSKEGNSNSHGTHVSGVIAKQHPNIRIVPIRVTTQTVVLSEDRKREIVNNLLEKFKIFMDSPYFVPLKNQISHEYGGLKINDSVILSMVEKYLKAKPLNAVFIQDVLSAVEAAGRDQVKLANVSLGTTFNKNHSLDKKKQSFTEDMFSEFARFQIGQTIQQKAQGTLFMIATGNDGGWIDGVSKSAFPVGITSMRLIKIAKQTGLTPPPNNQVKNVLAVASINPNGTLTPFTNILLDPNIPQIFSTGEEIKSSIPGKSIDNLNAVVADKMSKMNQLLTRLNLMESNQFSKKIDSMTRKDMKGMQDTPSLHELNLDISKIFSDGIKTLIHAQNPIDRVNMSGTSMATPTVTGLIAEYIANKMTKEKITSDQVYDHPSFKPEKIISEIMAVGKANSLTPMLTIKMLVEGIKTWKSSKTDAIQSKAFRQLISPRCQGVFLL